MRRILLLGGALATGACELLEPPTGPYDPVQIEEVPTALPAFLGFTERVLEEPERVRSMAELRKWAGGPPPAGGPPFALYRSLELYFANGGEEALVVPVGTYDASPTEADFSGGLEAVPPSEAPTLVLMPDAAALLGPKALPIAQARALRHCADHGRFCLLDLPRADVLADTVQAFRAALPTGYVGGALSYGAAYVPWVQVPGDGSDVREVPPSGAVAGVMARVDREQGVWVAPADEPVRGVSGLTHAIDDTAQQSLTVDPTGLSINPLREFTGRGIVVWGSRTLAGNDTEWRYVPVRRLALMLERSVTEGTSWVVFEPNDEPLWARIEAQVGDFLDRLWRRGAFQGERAQDAYFVRVGRGTSMTEEDVRAGRVIVELGFAPLRPAEFVILRIVQEPDDD